MSDISVADKAVAAVEKTKSDADAKVAQEKKDAQAKVDAQKMDLDAIAKGDYSSIAGTYSAGEGYPNIIGFPVTVSNTMITIDDTPWQFNKIVEKSNGSLTLWGSLGSSGMINLTFVPKGVKYTYTYTYVTEETQTTNSTVDRIVQWTSKSNAAVEHDRQTTNSDLPDPNTITISATELAAIDKTVKSAQTALDKLKSYSWAQKDLTDLQVRLDKVAPKGMNLDQIALGDYSSIQGTWKSPNDEHSLTFNGNQLGDNKGRISIIKLGNGMLVGEVSYTVGGFIIYFIPKGVNVPYTDSTKDRIFGAQDSGSTDPSWNDQLAQSVMYLQ